MRKYVCWGTNPTPFEVQDIIIKDTFDLRTIYAIYASGPPSTGFGDISECREVTLLVTDAQKCQNNFFRDLEHAVLKAFSRTWYQEVFTMTTTIKLSYGKDYLNLSEGDDTILHIGKYEQPIKEFLYIGEVYDKLKFARRSSITGS